MIGRLLRGLFRLLVRAAAIVLEAAVLVLTLGYAARHGRRPSVREQPPEVPLPPSLPEARAESVVGAILVLAIAIGIGFGVAYAMGGQPQILAATGGVAAGLIGTAIILWEKHLLPGEQVIQERGAEESPPEERLAAEAGLARGEREITRRGLLAWLLGGALSVLGIAALFPVRSLGPGPGTTLFRTAWRRGSRVVREDGTAVHASDFEIGSILTVFPDGAVGDAASQTLLIRVEPGLLLLPPKQLSWAPQGYIAFSKICTHAGCPVGLYRALDHQLLCPCHQSTFDVLRGAEPVFGPATRPLPQLPLALEPDGTFRALGDFPVPVGPGWWNTLP
jgi:ubiquinol-cytochrome c reductase iron-sulfur subunit